MLNLRSLNYARVACRPNPAKVTARRLEPAARRLVAVFVVAGFRVADRVMVGSGRCSTRGRKARRRDMIGTMVDKANRGFRGVLLPANIYFILRNSRPAEPMSGVGKFQFSISSLVIRKQMGVKYFSPRGYGEPKVPARHKS